MTDKPSEPRNTAVEPAPLPEFLENPKRLDVVLMVLMGVIVVWGFAMVPLRGWLLSHPLAYDLLVGGYTSAVISGAYSSDGQGTWWVYLAANILGAVKWVPIYWLMGLRWGHDFLDLSVQYLPRVRTFLRKYLLERSTQSITITAALVPLSYLPGPVPANIVNAVLGIFRLPWWVVLVLNAASVAVVNGIMMRLGWIYGDQVLAVVEVVNRYLLWITLALLALVFFRAYRQAKRAR